MGSALDTRDILPKIVYFTYFIRGARNNAKLNPEEFLGKIEFAESVTGNMDPLDTNARYFHSFAGTEDYLGSVNFIFLFFWNVQNVLISLIFVSFPLRRI